jgi:Protein of unknown function (DUF3500)
VPRPGLPIGTMSAVQRDAEMHLLQVLLKPQRLPEGSRHNGLRSGAFGRWHEFLLGRSRLYDGIFGTPSTTTPWMLEFAGHHLGLNVTIAGQQGVMTPNPARGATSFLHLQR